jgi:ABC 3 transport family
MVLEEICGAPAGRLPMMPPSPNMTLSTASSFASMVITASPRQASDTPAAAAQRLTSRIGRGLLLSAVLALLEAWAGITLAFYTDWPSSFWISALSAGVYLFAAVWPTGWIRRPA